MTAPPARGGLGALRAFARGKPAAPPRERCELCGADLGPEHEHLLDRERSAMRCACEACAILFQGEARSRWRRVRRRVERIEGLSVDDARWEALGIPIGLAFISRRESGAPLARYPSPGGAIASEVPEEALAALLRDAPPAQAPLEPEVEALLFRRLRGPAARGDTACDCYRVSIDVCLGLAGIVRRGWRGLSGGDEVHAEVGRLFDALAAEAGGTRRG